MLLQSPVTFPKSERSSKWGILQEIHKSSSITFTLEEDGFHIREVLDSTEIFDLRRDVITDRRFTNKDVYGLLGLSRINLQDPTVYLTEGVSDYITVSNLLPNRNVLGVTQLGGSQIARKILISLFDTIYYFADNDTAGLNAVSRYKKFFYQYNIPFKFCTQPLPFKDITDRFISAYRQSNTVYF